MNEELKNKMVEKEGDLLYTTLAEECSEVIQACTKIARNKYFDMGFYVDNLLEELCDLEMNIELVKEQLVNEKFLELTKDDIDNEIEKWHNQKEEKLSKIFLK